MTLFDYFQLVAAGLIVCVIATKVIYLRVTTGINAVVIGRGKGPWRVIEILSLGSLLLWMGEMVLHALHSPYDLFPETFALAFLRHPAVSVTGVVFVTCGLIIFILAFLNFGNSWRIGIDRQTPGTLVTGGIFGITRNPIYVAFNLIFAGVFLINGTIFFFVFALLAAVAVHFQILREEEFLNRQYGEEFQRYRRRTPRYLIW
jgi:protein-S-isoprenylcysteine O-methyltransferase Ste14